MARAVAGLLGKCGVDFGILGEEEPCDGNEVRVLGETGLLVESANVARVNECFGKLLRCIM